MYVESTFAGFPFCAILQWIATYIRMAVYFLYVFAVFVFENQLFTLAIVIISHSFLITFGWEAPHLKEYSAGSGHVRLYHVSYM